MNDPFELERREDRHHLASWLRKKELDAEASRQLARIELETAAEPPVDGRGRHPGDARRLRGIPAIGLGVAGVMDGTDPEREALRHDARLADDVDALFRRVA